MAFVERAVGRVKEFLGFRLSKAQEGSLRALYRRYFDQHEQMAALWEELIPNLEADGVPLAQERLAEERAAMVHWQRKIADLNHD